MTGAGGLWILLHLLYLSVEDIRERQVSLFVIAELGGTGMIYALIVEIGRAHVGTPVTRR